MCARSRASEPSAMLDPRQVITNTSIIYGEKRRQSTGKCAGGGDLCNKSYLFTALLLSIAFAIIWNHYSQHKTSLVHASPMHEPVSERFGPTIANKTPGPGAVPREMVWISGGEFSMGAQDPPDMDEVGMRATFDSRPIHRVYVDGFYMDKTDVTNGQFAKFVKATGYLTVAERKPRSEDFPGAPPESLIAGSVVFSPPDHAVPLNNYFQWWKYIHGANWRHPLGPGS